MTSPQVTRYARAAGTVGAALVTVLVLAGCSSQEPGGPQSAGDVDTTLLDGGLVVCTSRPAPNPPGTQALQTQTFDVGTNDQGESSAEGVGGDGVDTCAATAVTRVTVSQYADQDAVTAGAQALQGTAGPDSGATVHTTSNLTILVQGNATGAPTYQVNEVLSKAGAS
jgi:hypothetical protein